MKTPLTLTATPAMDGERLDKVLAELLPDSGLRLRRRLCDEGRVLVDEKPRKPGYKLRTGQEVSVDMETVTTTPLDLGLEVVGTHRDYAAVYKPGGVHSAVIEGSDQPSAESVLPVLFPGREPVLLNRLDQPTSGLLMVALSPEAVRHYHRVEDKGGILKYYEATVSGRFDGMTTVKNELDTDDRRKTRVLATLSADPRRWTDVQSMAHDRAANTSLVRCLISKGARHQIRAHLARIEHPILGDELYGAGEPGGLRLCHLRLSFEDVDFTLPTRLQGFPPRS